jgi:predicted ester cyclase
LHTGEREICLSLLDYIFDSSFVKNIYSAFTQHRLEYHREDAANVLQAIPDFEMTVERIMSEGDKVVFWVSSSCTQIGYGIIQQLGVFLARKKKKEI